MRARILIVAGLILVAYGVSGFPAVLNCSANSLNLLATCVDADLASVQANLSTLDSRQSSLQAQVSTLNSRLTALSTTVSTLQPSALTAADLVGTFTTVTTKFNQSASGSQGTNGGILVDYQTKMGALVLNQDMSFSSTETATESQIQFGTSGGGQNSSTLLVTVAPQVVTQVVGEVFNTTTPKNASGTWSLSGSTVTLTPTTGNPITFTVASNGQIIVASTGANSVFMGFKTP